MSKEEILLQRVIFWSKFCVFEYTFHRFFSKTGYHLRAKILGQGDKIIFVGTSPYKFR